MTDSIENNLLSAEAMARKITAFEKISDQNSDHAREFMQIQVERAIKNQLRNETRGVLSDVLTQLKNLGNETRQG